MPLKVANKNANADVKAEVKEKAKAAVEAEQPVESVNSENLGSLSDKLSFVAALGDPSQDDVTYFDEVGADGKKKKRTDPMIVGYRFVASVDLDVPDVAPGDDLKKNLMSYTGDTLKTRKVPAGTEFDLTKFETGMLISREEFNGRATGGQIPVSCSYASKSKTGADGKIATTSGAAEIPSIAIRAIGSGTSVKDVEMIPVLSFTKSVDPKTKVVTKVRTINPGFEKWEPLTKRVATTRKPGSGSSSDANKRNKMAAAFLQIASKKAN